MSRLCLDDLSILKGAPSLKTDGRFHKREGFPSLSSFADNQRTMRLRCATDTKSAAIKFTCTLH